MGSSVAAQSSQFNEVIVIESIDDDRFPEVSITLSFETLANSATNLTPDEIELELNGTLVPDVAVRSVLAPASFVMVIDSSESMAGRPLQNVQDMIRELIAALEVDDEVAIIDFDSTPRQVLTLSTDRNAAYAALTRLTAGGQTALFDAAVGGAEVSSRSSVPRRFIVLISDGNEYGNLSDPSSQQRALDLVNNSELIVFTVGLGQWVDSAYLSALANDTGQYFSVDIGDNLVSTLASIRNQVTALRTRYVISFNATRAGIRESEITLRIRGETLTLPYSLQPEQVVRNNNDWNPVFADFNGIEMALVPSGCFAMGSELSGTMDEKPVSTQCFERPFWLGRFEVTNVQFGTIGEYEDNQRPQASVTWSEASEFCTSLELRLPTEAEWEYGARGPSGWIYPWGVVPNDTNGIFAANSSGVSAVVGSSAGLSWVGSAEMAGNLWEWTLSQYQPYPYNSDDGREDVIDTITPRVLRGGSFDNQGDEIYTTNRFASSPDIAHTTFGFRCARDFQPEDEILFPETTS